MRRVALISLTIVIAVLAGCGSSDTTTGASTSTRPETAQKPAKLPYAWTRKLNNEHGFSIGVPPGWSASDAGNSVLYRSPDRLVALTLSVDRTTEAFDVPVDEFARQTLTALGGYDGKLVPSPPRKLGGTPLETALVSSTGTAAESGVRQDVEVAVLRRDHVVNYTAVIAANAKSTPPAELELAAQILKTLRDLPIA
jgi:hypothetical protein